MSSIFLESQNNSKASIGSRGQDGDGVGGSDKSTRYSYGDGVSMVTGNEGDPGVS